MRIGLLTNIIEPLVLAPTERYLVVVGPLVTGLFGMFDTDTRLLTPFRYG